MAEGFIVRRGAIEDFVPVVAIGGVETVIQQDGKFYRVHTYTDVGTDDFEVLRGGEVEYLVVAGGGGGGGSNNFGSGGGGGGGLLQGIIQLGIENYSILVGSGGTGNQDAGQSGLNGQDSSALGFTCFGGGFGAGSNIDDPAGSGGSGGGGSGGGGNGLPGLGTAGQGNSGGSVQPPTGSRGGAGGGGAGSAGGEGTSGRGGDGGEGILSSINGTLTAYAFGGIGTGGVAGTNSGVPAEGGTPRGISAPPNTGGGGTGVASAANDAPSDGGSGIVIIRYRITQAEFEAA